MIEIRRHTSRFEKLFPLARHTLSSSLPSTSPGACVWFVVSRSTTGKHVTCHVLNDCLEKTQACGNRRRTGSSPLFFAFAELRPILRV